MGKKFWLAVVISFVVSSVLGYVFYMVLMGDFFKEAFSGIMREKPIDWVYGPRGLIITFIFTLIYKKGFMSGAPLTDGLSCGFWLGLLTTSSMALDMYASMPISGMTMIIGAIPEFIIYLVMGVVVAYVMGKQVEVKKA